MDDTGQTMHTYYLHIAQAPHAYQIHTPWAHTLHYKHTRAHNSWNFIQTVFWLIVWPIIVKSVFSSG